MLVDISIQNFALIESWQLSFQDGESVITGETGSGKSLFVDALDFLSGQKFDRNLRRDRSKPTLVEASFLVDTNAESINRILDGYGIEAEDLVIISREADDRSTKTRINSRIVSQQALRELTPLLLDIHSQNAQTILADSGNYIHFLDRYIGPAIEAEKDHLSDLLKKLRDLEEEKKKLNLSPEEIARRTDLLEYQIHEIEEAGLDQIDEEALNREYKQLSNAKDRLDAINGLLEVFHGDYSLRYGMESVAKELDSLSRMDKELTESKDLSWQIEAELETLEENLESYRDRILVDPVRIEEIDEIFLMLQKLKRKYGQNGPEILAYLDRCRFELDDLQMIDRKREGLVKQEAGLQEELADCADRCSSLRKKGAEALQDRIIDELRQMAIRKLSFSISLTEKREIDSLGRDRVDFLISTNEGEEMKSVDQVASGGEMSRFMLAFKIVIADIQQIPTIIFDEIDTGISGRTAQVVGEKLLDLSRSHQILVITHLPQIAALAHYNYRIIKMVTEGRTLSTIDLLDRKERIEEQARLIGGMNITAVTKQSAEEMLDQAANLQKARRT